MYTHSNGRLVARPNIPILSNTNSMLRSNKTLIQLLLLLVDFPSCKINVYGSNSCSILCINILVPNIMKMVLFEDVFPNTDLT